MILIEYINADGSLASAHIITEQEMIYIDRTIRTGHSRASYTATWLD